MIQNPLILCIESRIDKLTSFYARFQIGPLTQGHGLTIRNALRRILLSELPNLSIIAVKIKTPKSGLIPHEYSSIEGIRESTLDILLNLKQISFQNNLDSSSFSLGSFVDKDLEEPILGFLKEKGPKIIRAKDIKLTKNIALVDPNQYICKLNENGNLDMDFLLGYGKNGKAYINLFKPESGLFFLEPTFNPILDINYKIDSTNSLSSNEFIFLDIVTNGSLHPLECLKIAVFRLQTIVMSLRFNPLTGFFLDSNFSNLKIEDNKNISDSYNSFFADFFDKNQKENLKKNDQISVKKGEIGFENTDLSTKSYADFNLLGKTISFTNSFKKRICSLDITNLPLTLDTYLDLKFQKLDTLGDLIFLNKKNNSQKLKEKTLKELEKLLEQYGLNSL